GARSEATPIRASAEREARLLRSGRARSAKRGYSDPGERARSAKRGYSDPGERARSAKRGYSDPGERSARRSCDQSPFAAEVTTRSSDRRRSRRADPARA